MSPKIVDVEARRALIAEACWRVIVREGIAGVTTRGLAREAGVGPGVLFHYFPDKEAIINAAFDLLADRTRQELRALVAQATDSLQRLRIMAKGNMPLDPGRFDEFGVWLAMWAHTYTSEVLRRRQQEIYQGWRELLMALVSDAIADGLLREDVNPAIAGIQLAGVTDGLIVHILLAKDSPAVAKLAVAAVDSLIDSWMVVPAMGARTANHPSHGGEEE